jgi:hypothetical protein
MCRRKIVDGVSWHYDNKNIFGCPGAQYAETDRIGFYCCNCAVCGAVLHVGLNVLRGIFYISLYSVQCIIIACCLFAGGLVGACIGIVVVLPVKGIGKLLCGGFHSDAVVATIGTIAVLLAGAVTMSVDLGLLLPFLIVYLCRFCCGLQQRCNIDAVAEQFMDVSFTAAGYRFFGGLFGDDD